jgi:hypothetical protein
MTNDSGFPFPLRSHRQASQEPPGAITVIVVKVDGVGEL